MIGATTNPTSNPIQSPGMVNLLKDQKGNNYFLQLIVSGDTNGATVLVNDYKKHINDTNNKGESALYLAIQSGFVPLAKKLVEMGADVLNCDNDGLSPLSLALKHEDILWAILDHQNIQLNSLAFGAFVSAIENGMEEAALKFFEKGFVFPLHLHGIGLKALQLSLDKGYEEIAKKLLTKELASQWNVDERYRLFEKALKLKLFDFALQLAQTIPSAKLKERPYLQLACQLGTPAIASYLATNIPVIDSYDWKTLPNFCYSDLKDHSLDSILSSLASRQGFEEVITLLLDKVAKQQKPGVSRNKCFSELCAKILRSYPELMKEKIALEIIKRMDPQAKTEDSSITATSPFDIIFIAAVEKNCQKVISLFLSEGRSGHLAPDLATLMQSLITAKTDRNESVAIQLINYWIASGLGLDELRQVITFCEVHSSSSATPQSHLLWMFNVCLQSDLCIKRFSELMEEMFIQLLQAALEGQLKSFEADFFKNALKIFSSEQITFILIRTMRLDEIKKEEKELKDSSWHKVLNLLVAMGSEGMRAYLEESLLLEIVKQFKSLSAKGGISCEEARALENLFPGEETTVIFDVADEETGERQLFKLNFFILTAHSGFFRSYFSKNWDVKKNLQANPTLFGILYKAISKKELELASLNQEDLLALRQMVDQFEMKEHLSILDHYSCDGKSSEEFYQQFCEGFYSSCDQKVLILNGIILNLYLSFENCKWIYYFLQHSPNIEILKIQASDSNRTILEEIVKKLPQLKEIHIENVDKFDMRKMEEALNTPTFTQLFSRPDYGFYFDGLSDMQLLNRVAKIPGLVIKGLGLRAKGELEVSSVPLENLQYLNLSDNKLDEKKLLELVKKTPKLREVNLRNCPSVSDGVLTALALTCPQLTSVNLCQVGQVDIIQFLKNCPNLEILKISPRPDGELEKIIKMSEKLSLYIDDKQVLCEKGIPQIPLIVSLINQKNVYLLESSLHLMLKSVLDYIMEGNKLIHDNQIITKILDKIANKKSDSCHPIISYARSITKLKKLKSLCLALADCQGLLLDRYLPAVFVQQLHKRLGDCPLSLPEARQLSRLFKGDKTEVVVKGSKLFFSVDPLILKSTGCLGFNHWAPLGKVKIFGNGDIFKYLHLYLTEGRVDLKRLNIHALIEICKMLNEYKLRHEDFFNSATDGAIGIKMMPYTILETIKEFLSHQKIHEFITLVDLTKIDVFANLQSILALVSEAKNLKAIRLTTKEPIPQMLWSVLKTLKMEIVLTLTNYGEVKQFSFPETSDDDCFQIRLERIKDFKFPSLSEYVEFIQRCPGLIEIDVSGYQLNSDSIELKAIISLCRTKTITTLKLGDCTKLTDKDLDLIAKNCLGLKTLISTDPERVKKAFLNNSRRIDCTLESELFKKPNKAEKLREEQKAKGLSRRLTWKTPQPN